MRVGISGHQNIQPESAVAWLEAAIREALATQRASVGVSSLAAGADQIFATVVLEMGLDLAVVTPCIGYESSFENEESKARFIRLNDRAKFHHLMDFPSPSEQAFLAAGKWIIDTSDSMIFIWDGRPARGLGGTADIVAYARAKTVPFVHLNPTDSSIARHAP